MAVGLSNFKPPHRPDCRGAPGPKRCEHGDHPYPAGLLLGIVGVFLVAWEVVRVYRGKKYQDPQRYVIMEPFVSGLEVKETTEYSAWEAGKYRRMKVGLVRLTLGVLLQIASNWIR